MKLSKHVGLCLIGKKRIAKYFEPIQYGVGGNVKTAAMRVKTSQSSCKIALDGTNAYNTLYRSEIMKAVFETPMCRPLWGLTALTIGAPNTYRIYEDMICGKDMVPEEVSDDIVQLPNSMGGLGLRSMVDF